MRDECTFIQNMQAFWNTFFVHITIKINFKSGETNFILQASMQLVNSIMHNMVDRPINRHFDAWWIHNRSEHKSILHHILRTHYEQKNKYQDYQEARGNQFALLQKRYLSHVLGMIDNNIVLTCWFFCVHVVYTSSCRVWEVIAIYV